MARETFRRVVRLLARRASRTKAGTARGLLVEALEPRILMSGDPLGGTILAAQQKNLLPALTVTPAAATVQTNAAAQSESWVGGATGAWDTAANWSGGYVPTKTTDVTIAGKVTVALGDDTSGGLALSGGVTLSGGSLATNGAATSDGTSLSGAALTLGGDLSLSGTTTLTGSRLTAATGTITNTGLLQLTGTGDQTIAGTLANQGTIALQGSGNLVLGTVGASVTDTNAKGAILQIASTGGIRSSVGQGLALMVENDGTVEKTGDAGTVTVDLPTFSNAGTVDVAAGTLGFTGGEVTGNAGASVTVEQGATLDLTSNRTETYGGTLTATGAGTVALASGYLHTDAAGFTLDAAPGVLQWTGGVIDAHASGAFTNAGTMTLAGSGERTLAGTLDNTGTIDEASGGLDLEYRGFAANYSGELDNSGRLVFQNDSGIDDGSFTNTGLIRKTGGTGTSTIATGSFTNTGGTLDAESGTIDIDAFNTTLAGGTLDAVANAEVMIAPTQGYGSTTVSGTLQGTGAGSVLFDDDSITVGAAGTTFAFGPGLAHVVGSQIDGGTGGFSNAGTLALGTDVSDPNRPRVPAFSGAIANAGTLDLAGTLSLAGYHGAATFTNEAGALIDVGGNSTIAGAGTLVNDGTLRVSGGGLSTINSVANFQADGTVDVEAGTLGTTAANWQGQEIRVAQSATLTLSGGSYAGTFTDEGKTSGAIDFGGGAVATGGATFDFDPGVFTWTGGVIHAVAGTLTNAGRIMLSGTGGQTLGGTLDNTGTIEDAGAGLTLEENTYFADYGGTLDNSGTYLIENDSGLSNGSVVNTGLLEKSAGTGESTIGSGLSGVGGTIDVLSGSLAATGAVELDDATLVTPTVQGTPTVIDLQSDVTFDGLVTGQGAGRVLLSGGGTYAAGAGGATLDFLPGQLQFQGGRLEGGSGGFTNEGDLTVDQMHTQSRLGGAWVNEGTIDIAGTSALDLDSDASLTNKATGLVDFQGDGAIYVGDNSATTFINQGTIRKSGGTLSSLDFAGLDTAGGTIAVDVGTLDLEASGTSEGGGRFDVASGATLDWSNGTYGGTYTGTGTGTVDFTGGRVASGGTTFDFNPGQLQWTGGEIYAGAGTFTNGGSMTIAGSVGVEGTFDNVGTIVQPGGSLALDGPSGYNGAAPATFHNSGTYDLENDGRIFNNFSVGAVFDNTGVIDKTVGIATATLDPNRFTSPGTVDVSAGTLDVSDLSSTAPGTLSQGTWEVSDGATLDLGGIDTNAATIAVDGAGSTFADLTKLSSNTGRLTITGGATLTTSGALDNTGAISVGTASTLRVGGDYTQGSAGTLTTIIAGPPASGDFGTLGVTGTAALDGTLAAQLAGGFAPTVGEDYPVLTFASATGAFATFHGPMAGASDVFKPVASPTAVTLDTLVQGADLAAGSVTLPSGTATPGQPTTVDFTVSNDGGGAAIGSWRDSVYLSLDGTFDTGSVLLGRVTHDGGLGAGASYTTSVTAALPAIAEGQYTVFVLADSGKAVPDSDRTDNLGAAAPPLAVTVPVLALGTPVTGTVASEQDAYYKVVAQPGDDVTLSGTFAGAGDAQIYVATGAPPTLYSFGQTTGSTDAAQSLTLANVAGGDIYVLVHGLAGAGTGAGFTLGALSSPLSITEVVSPVGAHDDADGVLAVDGTRFTPNTTISLVAADGTRYAASTTYISPTALSGGIDLTKLPLGSYTVMVTDGAATAAATSPYSVLTNASPASGGSGGDVAASISSPAKVGVGAGINVKGILQNFGDTPEIVSSFVINATGTSAASAQVISSPTTVPAAKDGTPGETKLGSGFSPKPVGNGAVSDFTGLLQTPTDDPLDLSALSADLKPATESQGAWDATFANVAAAIGTTQDSLYAAEQRDEIALDVTTGTGGATAADALELEIVKASDALPTPVLDSATDLSYPAPGLSLTFERSFQTSVAGRQADGRLGQGWVDNWDYAASLDGTTKVASIREGAATRLFTENADGSFTASPGDTGTLTEAGGAFRLTEAGGVVTVFKADGTLDHVQDANGNSITAGYTDGRMTSLTASDGAGLTIAYDSAGTIASVTDPTGRTASYAYDASGKKLTSVTTAAGTSTYTYGTDTAGATAYELTSVGDPGGTHVFFGYDGQGRLAREQADGGANAVTYAYGANSYSATDAAGHTTTTFFDQAGEPVTTVDALGHATAATFNGAGQVTSLGEVGGGASTIGYGTTKSGESTTTATDPLGGKTTLTYTPGYGALTSSADQDGNVTAYGRDAKGDLTSVTYADGTETTYAYASDGSVTQSVDRNGVKSLYTYDMSGNLLSRTLSDGSTTAYTYDAHGDLLTATDAGGTVAMAYDGAGRLTRVTDPDGRFLAYTYDAAGRRTSSTDQDGFTTEYSYDAQGRLAETTDGAGALIARYTYDAVGNVVRQDDGNGTYTTKAYDAAGDVLSIVNHAPDGSVNSRFDYTYDALGRVATMATLAGTARYSYDADSRLTGATLADGTAIAYSYDAAGNRTAVVTDGVSTRYTANDLDEYATVGGKVQAYDAAGDLTSGGGSTYTYDVLGRLASATNASGTWTYAYDALGDRSSETHDGVTTSFLVDPTGLDNVVAAYDAGGRLVASYTYGNGLTSQVTGSGAAYYDFDALGSTVGLSGASGRYVASYSYDPFGKVLSSTGSATTPFQYEGQLGVQSDGSGLDDMRARSYDPTTGRFTQSDPTGIFGGANTYTFGLDDPTDRVDPSGLLSYLQLAEFALAAPGNVTTVLDSLDGSTSSPGFYAQIVTGYLQNTLATGSSLVAEAKALSSGLELAGAEAGEIESIVGVGVGGAKLISSASVGLAFFAIQAEIDAAEHAIEQDLYADLNSKLDANAVLASINARATNSSPAGSSSTKQSKPVDPNYISGPAGYGNQQYVVGGNDSPYYIEFSNEPTATAPARTVTVTEQLDPSLDLSTFELGSFGFGDTTVDVPAGLQSYQTRVDDRAETGVLVDVSIGLDDATRTLTATFTSIDPSTLDAESDVSVGFLPPDTSDPAGAGFINYSVEPKAGLASGATVTAQASVVFDTEAPIATNAFVNTIDADRPTSQVAALPSVVASGAIPLTWSGSDGAGSGIASYSIFVSTDGGSYLPFLENTTATSATFQGSAGHSYGFYSVATDNVGYSQAVPAAPDASTTVDTAPAASPVTGAVRNRGGPITLAASYTDPDAGDSHGFTVDTTGTKGVVTNNGDGTFGYSPNGAFDALTLGQTATDRFTYTVTDREGLSSTAAVTITVTGQDTAPAASPVTGAVSNRGAPITLAASYTDPDAGDSHSFAVDTAGTKGAVTNNGDGTFGYSPNGAFDTLTLGQTATDRFTYTVTDREGLSSTAAVTITVTGQDTAPAAANDGPYVVGENTAFSTPALTGVLANDKGFGPAGLTAELLSGPTHGTVALATDGSFTYRPDAGFTGPDSFSYRASDGTLSSAPAAVALDVEPAKLDTLTLRVAAQNYRGSPQFIVMVDGVQVGGVQTATAPYRAGQYQDITLTGAFGTDPKSVTVTYINDAYGGSAARDRNLIVESLTLDGKTFLGSSANDPVGGKSRGSAVLDWNGTITFDVAPAQLDTLTLRVAAQNYRGSPEFVVNVDGVQVGGVQTVSAPYRAGQYQDVTLTGSFGADPRTVTVTYINDAYGGSAARDRNLIVERLTLDGATFRGAAAIDPVGPESRGSAFLDWNGTITFNLVALADQPGTAADPMQQRPRLLTDSRASDFGVGDGALANPSWQAAFVDQTAPAHPSQEGVMVSLG